MLGRGFDPISRAFYRYTAAAGKAFGRRAALARRPTPGAPGLGLRGAAALDPISRRLPFRSYMLLRFLQRGGCDANWMIGVRTWPFEAHCWLQLEDVALDDRSERLVRFQPILAL